jgi:hypothetical protein
MPNGPIHFSASGGDPFRLPIDEHIWQSLPVLTTICSEDSELWLGALEHLCSDKGFGINQITQNMADGNEGIIEITPPGQIVKLELVWRKPRNKALVIRLSFTSGIDFPEIGPDVLVKAVHQKMGARQHTKIHRQGQLEYYGKKWAGEFWLDDAMRLGPPSMQFEEAIGELEEVYIGGPRVILLDALVDSFGQIDWTNEFDHQRDKLALFLTVLLGRYVGAPRQKQVWCKVPNEVRSEIAWTGYVETNASNEMPLARINAPVVQYSVVRPDLTPISSDYPPGAEIAVPSDTLELWKSFKSLRTTDALQFAQAAAKFQESLYVWDFRRTLSFSLNVVACEALKPTGRAHENKNHEYTVRSLLGKDVSKKLSGLFSNAGLLRGKTAQRIRNEHIHRGKWFGSEFQLRLAAQDFGDPTFDVAERYLRQVTQAALIEWLRRA